MENGRTIRHMDLGNTFRAVEESMKDIGKMIKDMDKESNRGKMEHLLKVFTSSIIKVEMESSFIVMVTPMLENLSTVEGKAKE